MIAWLAVAWADCADLDEADRAEIDQVLTEGVGRVRAGQQAPKAAKTARKYDKKGWLCTPDHQLHAAILMAQGYDVKRSKRAYELTEAAMKAHAAGASTFLPYAYDRFRVASGLPQRYATMTGGENGRPCLFPVEDPANDEERAQYGLPPLAERYQTFATSLALQGDHRTYGQLGTSSAICHGLD